jgi:hypothetical protein
VGAVQVGAAGRDGKHERGRLDRLRRERETFDGVDVRVDDRDPGGDGEDVAHDQAGEHERGRGERRLARPQRQHDREHAEQDGRRHEADPGAGRLPEMVRRERRVDARADRTGHDHGVGAELGGAHVTITVPCMSWLCRVHS